MMRQTWIFAPPAVGEECRTEAALFELLKSVPGVLRLERGTVSSRSTGEIRVGSLIDVYFRDEDGMNAAYASPDGKRISREVMNNPAAVVEVLTFDDIEHWSPGD